MLRTFRQGARDIALRASLVGAVTMAVLAVGSIGAAGASAAPSCEGESITGGGSALQQIAQQDVWIPSYSSQCPEGSATVNYVPTSSGDGLAQWSAFGGETINHERAFIGTTLAPDAEQLASIKAATGKQNEEGEQSQVEVVPVAQSALAIVVNPPANCNISEIKRNTLEAVLKGKKKEWSNIGTASGRGCNQPITRVVPSSITGASYQLKHYLGLIDGGELPCLTAPNNTWDSLQAASLNASWPEACKGHKHLTALVHAANEVATVNSTSGSFGFAGLAEAESGKTGGTTVLAVQNGSKPHGGATYASPVTAGAEASNCAGATYEVPAEGQPGVGSGLSVDWSGTYGSALESSSYPICTLTWDLAFNNYRDAGFTRGQKVTVVDYLFSYMFEGSAQGQADIAAAEKWYAPLPTTGVPATDVLEAAAFAASDIG
jgi:ABC-type phosphate transport system substrate-binding protein